MGQNNEKCLNFHSINLTKSNESFLDSEDENFSNESFLEDPSYINNHSKDCDIESKDISEIKPVYIHSYSKDFYIDWENANDSSFAENFPINYAENFVTNEKEENASNSQQYNSIINRENENKNSAINETHFISQENFSQNNSNKGKKLLGRKKNGEIVNQTKGSSHDMYSNDNISIKTQTHFLNFIIAFLNCILPHFNYNKKLYKLDKKIKINIKKKDADKNVKSLNDKTIRYIVSNEISKKYKSIKDKTNANKNICEEIKDNPVLNKILSENYLVFFKKFYYKSDSYINLKDYGLDKDIIFTKDIKNFKHFLKENEKRGNQYIMSIKRHVLKKYLPGSIFIC